VTQRFESYFIASVLVAWSITEVIRYTFYALKLYDICPYPLLWIRYTAFLILYPLGVSSELALTFFRLGYYRENRPFSVQMPNKWNWSLDSYMFVWLMIIGYAPGFPQLFGYMLHQRKKVLNPTAPPAKKAQ
jgi:very-long-chain (3R)-3-hydroxyacyl-CoA dehydratase